MVIIQMSRMLLEQVRMVLYTDILKIWFSNYKGSGEVIINGFGDEKLASEIFFKARKYYLDN